MYFSFLACFLNLAKCFLPAPNMNLILNFYWSSYLHGFTLVILQAVDCLLFGVSRVGGRTSTYNGAQHYSGFISFYQMRSIFTGSLGQVLLSKFEF